MRNVRNGEQQFALRGVQFGDALVGPLDAFGKLLHLRKDGVCALLFFFEARDFVTGFIALRLAMLVFGNKFAPLFVQRAKAVEFECDVAALRHLGEDVQMFPEVA